MSVLNVSVMATNREWFHVHQGHKTKENRLKKKAATPSKQNCALVTQSASL